ncbi:MAG: toll/interleukin-1 receptor domain-containing protein [Thermoleophilaceae bacterium]
MASAFISYAHEDQEFMLALAEQLQGQELEIRYDQVVLHIGDSLIEKLSQEIAAGDFLVAIVSPDSVKSNWCQHELALAATQGINEHTVKVLPVKFRGAEMPPMLASTYWADADRHAVETVARQLAAAMGAHLEGADDAAAARRAVEAQEAEGEPAHAETAGDVGVAQIEQVAQRAWDVFHAWTGVWDRGGNISDLDDPQRRLRWALEALPERVRGALPLVAHLATSDWGGFFEDYEPADAETEIRQELTAARTRIAQGLPVRRRWMVVADHGQVSAGRRDAVAYLWEVQRGQETRRITVYISGTAMASDDGGLPGKVVAAKNTRGRSVLSTLVGVDDPPREVMATTAGISLTLPD